MVWPDYINTIKEQIRNKKAQLLIEDELRDHYEEQVKAYQEDGVDRKEAEEKAVLDMGDPIDVGTELNRVHRPRLERKLLGFIILFGVIGLLVQYLLYKICLTADQPHFFMEQVVYTIVGIIVMTIIYFIDYTIIGKYPLLLWVALYLISYMYLEFGRWHTNTLLFLYQLLYLFIPLFAGVLFKLRKWKLPGLFLAGMIGVSPLLLGIYGNNFSSVVHYSIIIIIMINIAVAKGWFGIRKIAGFVMIWGSVLSFVLIGLLTNNIWLKAYQKARLLAVFFHLDESMGFLPNLVRNALASSKLFGSNTALIQKTPVVDSNFVLVFIFNVFGIVIGSLIVGLIIALIYKAFRIAKKQRSYLGYMVGLACALPLLLQSFLYCLSNLGVSQIILLISQQSLPFLSGGARNTIYSYAILGLLLSVHRNSELISDRMILSSKKSSSRKKMDCTGT